MRNFYAIQNTRPGLVDEDGLPTDTLYVFSSIKDRDQWVDGYTDREVANSDSAARLMRRYIHDSYIDMREIVSMSDLVTSYLGLKSQDMGSVDRRIL